MCFSNIFSRSLNLDFDTWQIVQLLGFLEYQDTGENCLKTKMYSPNSTHKLSVVNLVI